MPAMRSASLFETVRFCRKYQSFTGLLIRRQLATLDIGRRRGAEYEPFCHFGAPVASQSAIDHICREAVRRRARCSVPVESHGEDPFASGSDRCEDEQLNDRKNDSGGGVPAPADRCEREGWEREEKAQQAETEATRHLFAPMAPE